MEHLLEDPHEDHKEVAILTADEIESDIEYIRVYPSEELKSFYLWLVDGEVEAIDHT
jgi:hypothetical protein|tara:strand:- start:2402 stop:2572 length:171 start_codon:yes stop_codon:yes gene_type:complete